MEWSVDGHLIAISFTFNSLHFPRRSGDLKDQAAAKAGSMGASQRAAEAALFYGCLCIYVVFAFTVVFAFIASPTSLFNGH
jgi:hypothetical protein